VFQNFARSFESLLQNAASHVNSGPTGHSNGSGHANFSKGGMPGGNFGSPGV
jgi:hypothetical protein